MIALVHASYDTTGNKTRKTGCHYFCFIFILSYVFSVLTASSVCFGPGIPALLWGSLRYCPQSRAGAEKLYFSGVVKLHKRSVFDCRMSHRQCSNLGVKRQSVCP